MILPPLVFLALLLMLPTREASSSPYVQIIGYDKDFISFISSVNDNKKSFVTLTPGLIGQYKNSIVETK